MLSIKVNNNAKRDAGFSLLELLIVVIVIGIIAAFAIPSLLGSKRGVDQKLAVTQLSDIMRAQKSYKDDLNIGRYATLVQLRNTSPGGNPLIDPAIINEDGDVLNYKGWEIYEIDNPTASSFAFKMVPGEGNPADYAFIMYEDGVIRRTGVSGPFERGSGTKVE